MVSSVGERLTGVILLQSMLAQKCMQHCSPVQRVWLVGWESGEHCYISRGLMFWIKRKASFINCDYRFQIPNNKGRSLTAITAQCPAGMLSQQWAGVETVTTSSLQWYITLSFFFSEKEGSWLLSHYEALLPCALIDTPGLALILVGHSTDVLWPQLSSLTLGSLTVPVQATWLPAEVEVGTGWGDF